jgi:ornithine cyclodeaminase/alanine dehydrogenase-like protein (mu-crystallin family)
LEIQLIRSKASRLHYSYVTMLSLTEEEVRARLDPRVVISAIEAAFRDRYSSTVTPPRTHLQLEQSAFLIMPCYDRSGRVLGVKLVVVRTASFGAAGFEDGPAVQATYMLLNPETGAPKLIIPANYLTEIRTAATSAVATKFLARQDASTLGIFGTGRQARAHATVLPLVRHFQRVLVCGREPRRAEQFVREITNEIRPMIHAVDARTCAAESDVICTCTTSHNPLIEGDLLRAGTHLNLIGAFQPHTREVDSVTVQRAQVVVDTYEGAMAEAGDLLVPIQEGSIGRDHIISDLHELVSGKRSGRSRPEDITIFKSVGCALEDLVTAELVIPSPQPSVRASTPLPS